MNRFDIEIFMCNLLNLETWEDFFATFARFENVGMYGWIVTLQEFLDMKVDETTPIDHLNAILLNFDNKVRQSWYVFI